MIPAIKQIFCALLLLSGVSAVPSIDGDMAMMQLVALEDKNSGLARGGGSEPREGALITPDPLPDLDPTATRMRITMANNDFQLAEVWAFDPLGIPVTATASYGNAFCKEHNTPGLRHCADRFDPIRVIDGNNQTFANTLNNAIDGNAQFLEVTYPPGSSIARFNIISRPSPYTRYIPGAVFEFFRDGQLVVRDSFVDAKYETEFQIPAPPPTPAPAPTPGVGAKGDPHLTNVLGNRFDLAQPGLHVLVHIPRSAQDSHTLLKVMAKVDHLGATCMDVYIQAVNVTGKWAFESSATHHRLRAIHFTVGQMPSQGVGWLRLGEVSLKVKEGRTSSGTRYLNVLVRDLNKVKKYVVGGLLGEDDHTFAATPVQGCVRTVDI